MAYGNQSQTQAFGTAAQYDIGTSGDTVPLNSGDNVFDGLVSPTGGFSGRVAIKGADAVGNPTGLTETQFVVQKTGAGVYLFNTFYLHGEAANEKYYDFLFRGDSHAFSLRAVSDDYNTSGSVFDVTRTGVTPLISFPNAVRLNGGVTIGMGETVLNGLKTGLATMVAGATPTISDPSVTAATSVILATPGFVPAGRIYYTINAGVGFTISSTNAADAGQISYQRILL